MPEITGKLLGDLHPKETVRMVFIAHTGSGNEAPLTAKSLDAAEMDFVRTGGFTPERAAELRAELDRNKVVTVETSIAAAIAAQFRYARPSPESDGRAGAARFRPFAFWGQNLAKEGALRWM